MTPAELYENSSIASIGGAGSAPGTEDFFGDDEFLASNKFDTGDGKYDLGLLQWRG